MAYVHELPLLPVVSPTSASCWGSATGNVRSSRLLTMEKMAVLAPMPSASDRIATSETTGVARSERNARRMSCMVTLLDGSVAVCVDDHGPSTVTGKLGPYNSRVTLIAMTREVSPAFAKCELTHLGRVAIDVDDARAQHDAYENALEDACYRIERLPAAADMPDAVFVEDAAIVF